jgi:CBS domain-containing protein
MKVEAVMTQNPKTCGPGDALSRAAQSMWENNCGSIPVVDERQRPMGMITDRDICMCAYTQGLPLTALPVSMAMSRTVVLCSQGEPVANVEKRMRQYKIRRLPVVGAEGGIVGVVSLDDIACEAEREEMAGQKQRSVTDREIAATLAAICSRHAEVPVAVGAESA